MSPRLPPRTGTSVCLEPTFLFTAGTARTASVLARASVPDTISVDVEGGPPNYPTMASTPNSISPLPGNSTRSESRRPPPPMTILQFNVGSKAANVWIDGVQLNVVPPGVYRRDLTPGTVPSATDRPRRKRLRQAPASSGSRGTARRSISTSWTMRARSFAATGAWYTATYNSGGGNRQRREWLKGPLTLGRHVLRTGLRSGQRLSGTSASPRYPANHTLEVWLPAAPSAAS